MRMQKKAIEELFELIRFSLFHIRHSSFFDFRSFCAEQKTKKFRLRINNFSLLAFQSRFTHGKDSRQSKLCNNALSSFVSRSHFFLFIINLSWAK